MIYFDNSATTKIAPSVLATYQQVSEKYWGNPSSLHHLGDEAQQMLALARRQIASLLNFDSKEIYFNSGGSEGDNWIIKGTAMEKQEFGRHIITTSVEHAAVTNSVHQLEKLGFEVTYLPVDKQGRINPADLQAAVRNDTILVSVMAVNNEVGTVQPIHAIARILDHYPKIHFHVDAVQALGKNLWSQIYDPRIDFMTFSAHKFHGPRGIGFIYAKSGRKIAPLIAGGGQEYNWRSGTENTPAIAAMARALRLALTDESRHAQLQNQLRQKLITHLKALDNVQIFSGLTTDFAPHIVCFALKGARGETIVHAFEKQEIYLSTTSACSSRTGDESVTLKAMHVPNQVATSAVRVSLDEQNTLEEMTTFIQVLDQIHQHYQVLN